MTYRHTLHCNCKNYTIFCKNRRKICKEKLGEWWSEMTSTASPIIFILNFVPASKRLITMKYPPNLRASWHEYNGGMYFVTFCTKDRMHYLGEIADGKMNLSEVGKFADEQFKNVTAHYPYSEIPLWVVMPDHIHAIIIIDHDKIPYERRIVDFSPVVSRRATTTTHCPLSIIHYQLAKNYPLSIVHY